MTRANFEAAMKMSGNIRWYEWSGQTIKGGCVVRAQSRTMMRSPLLAVTGQSFRVLESK